MGWSIGWDEKWKRDIGYGVPAICDHPRCSVVIDRGLANVCCSEEPRGGIGCGLYFCSNHHGFSKRDQHGMCGRCHRGEAPFSPKPEHPMWIKFKMVDPSWLAWREENGHPDPTEAMRKEIAEYEDSLWKAVFESAK